MSDGWRRIPIPGDWSTSSRRSFLAFARSLSENGELAKTQRSPLAKRVLESDDYTVRAAARVLQDLASQGWTISVGPRTSVAVAAPDAETDPEIEKARIRQQELLKRDEQLSLPSVQRFVRGMERPREFQGRFVSIFNLMRDGRDLAEQLQEVTNEGRPLRSVVDPYVQVVGTADRCAHTGLRLVDVWRYFRHTWTNQHTSTPGRTMLLLVRDRASENHPVVGIAALASPIVQLAERDRWIGWQASAFLTQLDRDPTLQIARWVANRLETSLDEIYVADLIRDGIYWPSAWSDPTKAAIEKLTTEAKIRRKDHHRFVRTAEMKAPVKGDEWVQRAESDLFRSKRCLALADLLQIRMGLAPLFTPKPTRKGLERCLEDPAGRKALEGVVRRAKSGAVGTEIADLTVCGAIAPYNAILGGKLAAMLAVSPTTVRAYREKYGSQASQIASSVAGRPIERSSRLVFIGTTSLYGSGSSQYNRLRIPAHVLESTEDVTFRRLGKSKAFGTSHLSGTTVDSLVQLAEQSRMGVRVNSIFGEGVSPKFRKVRDGLDLLGWPANDLLRHGRHRIVYGVSLIENLLPYLLGIDKRPRYLFDPTFRSDVERITDWWFERWVKARIRSEDVLTRVAANSLDRPVQHGGRVALPPSNESDQP
jgi:Domain of unknown function (DUF4338)